jgi:hypothetical protein
MDQRVVREVLWTSQRLDSFAQGRTAHRKKRIAQQVGGFATRPATGTVADADIHSLRSEIDEPAAGIDAQVL